MNINLYTSHVPILRSEAKKFEALSLSLLLLLLLLWVFWWESSLIWIKSKREGLFRRCKPSGLSSSSKGLYISFCCRDWCSCSCLCLCLDRLLNSKEDFSTSSNTAFFINSTIDSFFLSFLFFFFFLKKKKLLDSAYNKNFFNFVQFQYPCRWHVPPYKIATWQTRCLICLSRTSLLPSSE